MNYQELQDQVIDWSNREDLADKIPQFIALAESEVRRHLTTKRQAIRAQLVLNGDTTIYCLPNNYKAMRTIKILVNGSANTLMPVSPSTVSALTNPSVPVYYSDVAQQLEFFPPPDSTYTVEMVYYQDLISLSTGEDTNWLLDQAPDIYLNGTMKYMSAYIKDYDAATLWDGPLQLAIQALEGSDHEDRWSGPSMEVKLG